jgi:hypothetical protein
MASRGGEGEGKEGRGERNERRIRGTIVPQPRREISARLIREEIDNRAVCARARAYVYVCMFVCLFACAYPCAGTARFGFSH